MSTSTATAPPPGVQRSSSSSRRVPTYTSTNPGQPQRSQPTSTRVISGASSTSKPSTQRSSYDRPSSQQQQSPLANVLPHRDYETSSLPRPSGTRRSSSQDRTYDSPTTPSRRDSTRSAQRTASRPGQSRYVGEGPPPVITNGMSSPTARTSLDHAQPPSTSKGRRTTITGQSGTWSLGKTIGAGSMGKVKLAKKLESGEQVRERYDESRIHGLTRHIRLLLRLCHVTRSMMAITAPKIENDRTIRKRFVRLEKQPSYLS